MFLYPVLHPIPYVLDKIEVWRVGRDLDIRYSPEEEVQLCLVQAMGGCVVLPEDITVESVITADKLLDT
jgi:hypothetical protein